jgi:MFS family permease
MEQMIAGRMFVFVAAFLMIFALRKFKSRTAWLIACFLNFIFIIFAYTVTSLTQFYLIFFLSGSAMFFFYVFYNIAHFQNASRGKIGYASAVMFSVGPVIGIFAPLLSGYLIEKKIFWFWALVICFFLIAVFAVARQNNFSLDFKLKAAFSEIKATRIFIFLQGIWEALTFGIIPIFTLYFIKSPLGYGAYIAYLALIAVGANLLLGHLTDRIKKRAVFLYPLTICMAIITALFFFAVRDLRLWIILSSLLQFLIPLFYNISTAMVVDAHSDLEQAMPARELVLAAGRFLGFGAVYLSFYFEKIPQNIFFFLAGVMLLYPLYLFIFSKWQKKYYYL